MTPMHHIQEDNTQRGSSEDAMAHVRIQSAATNIRHRPSLCENDASDAADQSPCCAAGANSQSPPMPTAQQPERTRVEGTLCTYTLREEIGRGEYGRVFLADATLQPQPHLPLQHSQPGSFLPSPANRTIVGLGPKGRSGPRYTGDGPRLMVLKRMDNTSVEDGLQAATLREIMVLDEVCAGNPCRDRVERDAFRCGRAVFRPTMAATSTTHVQESFPSARMDHNRYFSGGAGEDEWDDGASSSSGTLRKVSFDVLPAQQRRRVNRGRQHLIGIRDAILRPREQLAYVVMDYCEGGDLWHFMRDMKVSIRSSSEKFGDIMSARVFRRWAVELILALSFLHSHNIAHRDLKPQNLMLAKRTDTIIPSPFATDSANTNQLCDAMGAASGELYTLKVGDFGLSRLEEIPYKKYVHEAVTLWYRSPDVLLGNTNYTYSADAWSLGCILVEMASGSVLFKGKDEADELRHIFMRGCRPSPSIFPRMREYHYSGRYAEVLSRYQEADAENMTSEELMQMHLERIIRHLRAFLRDRHALELLGDAGVDLVARLLILDPERRLTVLEAMNHRFFTNAYAEVYGADL